MSVLAMILMAAMAVPADGPEKPSMEVVQELDLSGEWEGAFDDAAGSSHNCRFEYRYSARAEGLPRFFGSLWTKERGYVEMMVTDEGKGRLRIGQEVGIVFGIYKQHDDKLTICYCRIGASRPTTFRVTENQHVIVLHRVKSRK